MKRFIVVLMALLMAMSCIACSQGEQTQPDSQKPAVNDSSSDASQEDLSVEEVETPDVAGDGFCIVVKMKSTNATINSVEDFSKYTVAYVSDTDSETYAKFYDFKDRGQYNANNDLHSGLMGGAFELGIVSAAGYESFAEDYDIVWDFTKNK